MYIQVPGLIGLGVGSTTVYVFLRSEFGELNG